jgi:glucose 1-dehydrogenase
MLLKGQTALVTGANSGIGAAIVKTMAAAGANACVNYISNQDAAEEIVREIKDTGGKAVAIKADISKEND